MNKWVRRSLNAGALTAGALLASGAAAHAGPTMVSTGNPGLLNGTQAAVPVQAPINLCGVAAAVGGSATADCDGGAAASIDQWSFERYHESVGGPTMTSTGNVGIGNGTQVYAPVQAPVNACGVAVGVLGTAAAECEGGAEAEHGEQPENGNGGGYEYHREDGTGSATAELSGAGGGGTTMVSSGNVGLLNGTQVVAPVQLPINICGVAVGVLGTATAACEGGSSAQLTL